MQESKLKMGRITRVFITHMHGTPHLFVSVVFERELTKNDGTADHVMGLVPLLGTLMTGVVTPPEEIERLRNLGRAKKVSCFRLMVGFQDVECKGEKEGFVGWMMTPKGWRDEAEWDGT